MENFTQTKYQITANTRLSVSSWEVGTYTHMSVAILRKGGAFGWKVDHETCEYFAEPTKKASMARSRMHTAVTHYCEKQVDAELAKEGKQRPDRFFRDACLNK